MKSWLFIALASFSFTTSADTIGRYMNIANNIPKMEMKADKQSHTWARSARTILSLTSESIAETLVLANEEAQAHGSTPLYCLPEGVTLNALLLNEIIQETYREISSLERDKNDMTVSKVALIGINRKFPCQSVGNKVPSMPPPNPLQSHAENTRIEHMEGLMMPPPPGSDEE